MNYYYTGNPSVVNPNKTGIVSRTDNSVLGWTDVNAALNIGNKVFQKGGQKTRAEYVIALQSNPLPVTLTSFTALQQNNTVAINWTTATEVNNDHFTVERSADGFDYEPIASVKGAGNSVSELNYNTIDDAPTAGTIYYKLTQTDFDGNTKTYGPVAVTFTPKTDKGFDVQKVYPTVFNSSFSANLMCDNSMDVNVTVYNLSGMVVNQGIMHCAKGGNVYQFNSTTSLQPGMYMIVFYDEASGNKVTEKVIKG
jgi:hypothetical protein